MKISRKFPGNFPPLIWEIWKFLEISNFLAGGQVLARCTTSTSTNHLSCDHVGLFSAVIANLYLICRGGTIDFLVSPLPDNFANCSSALWSNYTRRNSSCKQTNLIIIPTTHNDCWQCCCGWFCRLQEVPLPQMYVCFWPRAMYQQGCRRRTVQPTFPPHLPNRAWDGSVA